MSWKKKFIEWTSFFFFFSFCFFLSWKNSFYWVEKKKKKTDLIFFLSRKKFFFIESKKKEWKCKFISYYIKNTNDVMIVCKWSTLTSQRPLENDHKTQQIWQIRHEKTEWFTRFSELKENRVDHTFWLHLRKNKQK